MRCLLIRIEPGTRHLHCGGLLEVQRNLANGNRLRKRSTRDRVEIAIQVRSEGVERSTPPAFHPSVPERDQHMGGIGEIEPQAVIVGRYPGAEGGDADPGSGDDSVEFGRPWGESLAR